MSAITAEKTSKACHCQYHVTNAERIGSWTHCVFLETWICARKLNVLWSAEMKASPLETKMHVDRTYLITTMRLNFDIITVCCDLEPAIHVINDANGGAWIMMLILENYGIFHHNFRLSAHEISTLTIHSFDTSMYTPFYLMQWKDTGGIKWMSECQQNVLDLNMLKVVKATWRCLNRNKKKRELETIESVVLWQCDSWKISCNHSVQPAWFRVPVFGLLPSAKDGVAIWPWSVAATENKYIDGTLCSIAISYLIRISRIYIFINGKEGLLGGRCVYALWFGL